VLRRADPRSLVVAVAFAQAWLSENGLVVLDAWALLFGRLAG
jgi:hypothetical protein